MYFFLVYTILKILNDHCPLRLSIRMRFLPWWRTSASCQTQQMRRIFDTYARAPCFLLSTRRLLQYIDIIRDGRVVVCPGMASGGWQALVASEEKWVQDKRDIREAICRWWWAMELMLEYELLLLSGVVGWVRLRGGRELCLKVRKIAGIVGLIWKSSNAWIIEREKQKGHGTLSFPPVSVLIRTVVTVRLKVFKIINR